MILSYADYESLELSLAVHSKSFLHISSSGKRIKLYILQNGRNTYDCERTLSVALRYQNIFPEDIEVITAPQAPYYSIKDLIYSHRFVDIDYIIKLDDDVFPLSDTWLDDLCECYSQSYAKYGTNLAYINSLVNNNPYGFKKTLEVMGLTDLYFERYARVHLSGSVSDPVITPKEEIATDAGGTVWRYPYLARFIHEQTTLRPQEFIAATKNLGYERINEKEKFSIIE